MLLQYMPVGAEGGHIAGRRLLKKMYEERFGAPMPKIMLSQYGQPYFQDNSCYFSISHTKKTVFCVLSDRPVGVDAELLDRQVNLCLADRILSPSEQARYRQAVDKEQALLRFWVLKEAAAKCSGKGLNGFPNHTDFSPEDKRIQIIDGHFVAVIEE